MFLSTKRYVVQYLTTNLLHYGLLKLFQNPSPAPEQTSSLIGLVTFAFLDSFVFLANRDADLEYDKIPPLLDTDAAAYLEQRAFPVRNEMHFLLVA